MHLNATEGQNLRHIMIDWFWQLPTTEYWLASLGIINALLKDYIHPWKAESLGRVEESYGKETNSVSVPCCNLKELMKPRNVQKRQQWIWME